MTTRSELESQIARLKEMQSYEKFAEAQISVAKCLSNGQCGGTYGDAAVILCSAISAMAARRWPGDAIDKKRFVQILVEADGLTWKKISRPLLAQFKCSVWGKLTVPDFPQVPMGSADNCDEVDVLKIAVIQNKNTPYKDIRYHSYASLLYTEIRCGYSHEMLPGKMATSSGGFNFNNTSVSYENFSTKGLDGKYSRERKIHFPIPAIAEAVRKVGEYLDLKCKEYNVMYSEAFTDAPPKTWWLYELPKSVGI